jgi:hypothetical protein
MVDRRGELGGGQNAGAILASRVAPRQLCHDCPASSHRRHSRPVSGSYTPLFQPPPRCPIPSINRLRFASMTSLCHPFLLGVPTLGQPATVHLVTTSVRDTACQYMYYSAKRHSLQGQSQGNLPFAGCKHLHHRHSPPYLRANLTSTIAVTYRLAPRPVLRPETCDSSCEPWANQRVSENQAMS